MTGLLHRLVSRLRALFGRAQTEPEERFRFASARGFPLRSHGEVLIADWLDARGYRWEYEARVGGFTPDFVLRDERVVVEYWGMKGHNKRYTAKIDEKKRRYRQHGWEVIGVERKHLNNLTGRLGKRLTWPRL